jgi:hypothetical protein
VQIRGEAIARRASLLRREADADFRMRIRNDRSSGILERNDEEIYGAR